MLKVPFTIDHTELDKAVISLLCKNGNLNRQTVCLWAICVVYILLQNSFPLLSVPGGKKHMFLPWHFEICLCGHRFIWEENIIVHMSENGKKLHSRKLQYSVWYEIQNRLRVWKHESESLVNQISVAKRFLFNTDFDRGDHSGKPATNKPERKCLNNKKE